MAFLLGQMGERAPLRRQKKYEPRRAHRARARAAEGPMCPLRWAVLRKHEGKVGARETPPTKRDARGDQESGREVVRVESRARATPRMFGIAERARVWGTGGRPTLSHPPRVDVIVGHGDILRWRERRATVGGWVGWDDSIFSHNNGTWLRKSTPWPNAVEL